MQQENNERDESESNVAEFSHLPDSDTYIRKLERRLTKVKGLNKNLTSKDMISVLQQSRDSYMGRLISSSVERLSPLSDIDGDREVSVSYLEKKIFPEKVGVTYEELQLLLDSDVLAKISSDSSTELNDMVVDR